MGAGGSQNHGMGMVNSAEYCPDPVYQYDSENTGLRVEEYPWGDCCQHLDSFGSSPKETPGNLVYWGVHLWQGL